MVKANQDNRDITSNGNVAKPDTTWQVCLSKTAQTNNRLENRVKAFPKFRQLFTAFAEKKKTHKSFYLVV